MKNFKTLILFITILILISCTVLNAQMFVTSSEKSKATNVQLSLLVNINATGSDKYIAQAVPDGFTKDYNNHSVKFKFGMDYFFTPVLGTGLNVTGFENSFNAKQLVGSIYDPGGWGPFGILYFAPTTTYYYDQINLEITGTIYSGYASYKLVKYLHGKTNCFEIISRAGFSVTPVSEHQALEVEEITTLDGNPSGYKVAKGATSFYNFRKTAFGCFANMQVAMHTCKHFSFIVADITQNFGIINPSVPATMVTSVTGKTVEMQEHKLTISGFSYSFGVAFHF